MNNYRDSVEAKRHKKNRSVIQNYKHAVYSLPSDPLEEEQKHKDMSNINYFGTDSSNSELMHQLNKIRRNQGNISLDNTEYILHKKHIKDDYFSSFKDTQQKPAQNTQLKLGLNLSEKNCSSNMSTTEGNFQLPQIMKKISKASVRLTKK